MSDADKAFEAAQKLIAKRDAIATIDLHLGAPDFRALEALPSSIADLIELTELSLANTQVRTIDLIRGLANLEELILSNTPIEDLTPLANLSNLMYVSINQTNVTDISAISGLTKISALSLDDSPILDLLPVLSLKQLKNDPTYSGLTFRNTSAARSDVHIGQIAEISDPVVRATELFAYLENWPLVGAVPPEDQPVGAHFAIGVAGRLLLTDPVLTDEDPEQQELHQDCRDKAHRLVGAFGQTNEYAGLKSSAEKYREVIARPASAIGARRLWSVGNTLNVALEAQLSAVAQGRDTEGLPPLVAAALSDLMATHGLFAMGHPGIAEVIRLIHEATHGPRNAAVLAAAGAVVESLQDMPSTIEAEALAVLVDDRAAATGIGLAAEKAETGLVASVGNLILMLGRTVWSATQKVTGLTATTAVVTSTTGVVGIWIAANKTLIEAFLLAQQGQIQPWVAWLLSLF